MFLAHVKPNKAQHLTSDWNITYEINSQFFLHGILTSKQMVPAMLLSFLLKIQSKNPRKFISNFST